jgi:putative membrane protein
MLKTWKKPPLVGFAITAMSAGVALADDQEFLTDAIKGDNSEVTLGNLAESKGASQGVRNFGKRLAVDHAKAKKQALAVAQQLSVPDTNALTDEATQEKAKLSDLSGSAFDAEFASYMVKDHQEDISKFEKQASQGSSQTAQLAKDTLPDLRKHLKMAQALEK